MAEKLPCSKCGTPYPRTPEYFNRKKTGRDGLTRLCKRCVAAQGKKWYEDHRDLTIQRAAQWTKDNPEGDKARNLRYRLRHAEEIRQRYLRYKAAHPDSYRETRRNWVLRNKDAHNSTTRNYRARKRGAEGSHTNEDVRRQYEAQEGLCYWCEAPVGDKYHVDHFIPLARGGSNWPDNIVIACPRCNTSKSDRLPEEFMTYLAIKGGAK